MFVIYSLVTGQPGDVHERERMKDDYLSVAETAKKLGISPRTVQRYCKDGRLNHKWVQGKRHKELRILPPIQISHLPCGRRKNIAGTFDYLTSNEFGEFKTELERKIEEKDRRIAQLEEDLEILKSELSGASSSRTSSTTGDLTRGISLFLREYQQVRPAEKKLILKIARELQALEDRMDALDINRPEQTAPDNEP